MCDFLGYGPSRGLHGGGVAGPSTAVQLESWKSWVVVPYAMHHGNDAADPEAFGQPRHRAPFVLVAEFM